MMRPHRERRMIGVGRWLLTAGAVMCLLAYLIGNRWMVRLSRTCNYTYATGSGTSEGVLLNFQHGSLTVFIGNRLVGPRFPPTSTVYGWSWLAMDVGRQRRDILPHLFFKDWIVVGVPMWIPALLGGAWAGLLWRAYLTRRGTDTCSNCGYDRRGLNADAKCPECGTVPAVLPDSP